MPKRKIIQFIPRQASTDTSGNSSSQPGTSPNTQASTIATLAPPSTSLTIPGTTNAPASSSTSPLSLAQPTSSQDVGTTVASATTTSSQPESSTSIPTSDIPSTSPDISTSTLTSQRSTPSTPPSTSTSSVSSSLLPISSPSSLVPFTTSTTSTYTTPTPTYGGQMTSYITSSYVTVIGSSTFTTTTVIPTIISSNVSNNTASNRTAIIAGSVIGGGVLLIITLSLFFYRQRKRFKRFHFLDTLNIHRRQARARATLLAGEDLDDVTLARPPPGRYVDYDNPWNPRDSSGSLGDSERGTLMDPSLRGADIDLSHIVDDVMGPSASGPDMHYYQNSVSSSYRDFPGGDRTNFGDPQTRELSNASQIALLEAAGLARPAPSNPLEMPRAQNDPIDGGVGAGGQL